MNDVLRHLKALTVIIPVRVTAQRADLIDRIHLYKTDTELPKDVDFLVVDDGSTDSDFLKLKERETDCLKVIRTGAKYYQPFSLARARNLAAQTARSRCIMFMDADLIPYPGFFRDMLQEVRLLNLERLVHSFSMVPVIYLSPLAYEEMKAMPAQDWLPYFINAVLVNDKERIEKTSSGTSVIILDRLYYLARGGQDTDFEGWGFEDYEFANRLIRRDRRYPLPKEWLSMAGNLITIKAYEGWKSTYRLYGDWTASKGIYLFHAPHPIEDAYHSRKDHNLRYLTDKMAKDASATPDEPEALPAPEYGTSLVFRRNPFCLNREFAPALGRIVHALEDDFPTITQFRQFLKDQGISRVVFPNPYANDQLVKIYHWCRSKNFPILVCERGALPDSVYHDPSGFLNDSTNYRADRWSRALSDIERADVLSYINDIRSTGAALEKQSARSDPLTIRRRLGLKRNQKVLFVPFQQPHDTVIRHFAGPVRSFANFRSEVESLARELGSDWRVVVKRHPAELSFDPIPGCIQADDVNVYDLLELCDAVAVINSGVGVLGMMFGKPVYVFGDSWYGNERLCRQIAAGENAARCIADGGFDLDFEAVLQFIFYLRFEFYSFGRMETKSVKYEDGSPITATTAIHYYELRGWTDQPRYLPRLFKPISSDSPLFDRYRNSPSTSLLPKKAAPPPAVRAPRDDGFNSWKEGDYAKAATLWEIAAKKEGKPQNYRAAAEAYDRIGNSKQALACLEDAIKLAKNPSPLVRRKKEMRRPTWLRKILSEKPYVPEP